MKTHSNIEYFKLGPLCFFINLGKVIDRAAMKYSCLKKQQLELKGIGTVFLAKMDTNKHLTKNTIFI